MEANYLSKTQRLSSDRITTLPQTIIEIILCLVPLKEAARTSILSKDWRYKWTTIPKLVFDSSIVSQRTSTTTQTSDLASARKNMDWRCKLFYVIHQVLLLRRGPIHEFTLYHEDVDRGCSEIDQIILHLSMNHALKKLTLWCKNGGSYRLPLCAFSLHQLTHLNLSYVDLDRQPIFIGFGNLRRLCLFNVIISTKPFLHLLSNCPSLMSLDMFTESMGDKDCTVIELFRCLPMIEHLETYMGAFHEMLVLDSVPKELPTSLNHLKRVCLKEIDLVDDGLCFLLVLIKCSPNLEKITLVEFDMGYDYSNEICSDLLDEYSDVWLAHLNELKIGMFYYTVPEIEFVKFILARSPVLKKVEISGVAETDKQESEMLKILLRATCISPVEFDVV